MKDITEIIHRLETLYAYQNCNVKDIAECPTKEKCTCRIAAEVRAYIQAVIPEGFRDFSIDDYKGRDLGGTQLVSDGTAVKAKEKLLSFCWGDISLDQLTGPNKLTGADLDAHSVIDRRKREGSNVIICADSEGGQVKGSGKTILASIIMREAIKRRTHPANHCDTYDWQDFSMLLRDIRAEQHPQSEYKLTDTLYCDWLVIDDIPSQFGSSMASRLYQIALLNPILVDRMEQDLSNILVFRFDITKFQGDVERNYGMAINKILLDPSTCVISLSK